MKIIFNTIFIIVLFIGVTHTQFALSEEITIIDAHGLIRLKKSSVERISVAIEFQCNPLEIEKPVIILSHEDGLLGDSELPWTEPCTVEANDIPPGRWRVKSLRGNTSEALVLKSVTEAPSK